MARMVPNVTPSGSEAEAEVYRALRDTTSEEYLALHSVPWVAREPGRPGQAVGEIDFLVIHPEHGLLVIEVKGGGVEYDSQENRWTSRGRGGVFTIHDPHQQAVAGAHRVLDRLKGIPAFRRQRPRVGHAVMFPDGFLPSQLPMDAETVWFGAECLDDMERSLTKAYDYWTRAFPQPTRLDQRQIEQIQRSLKGEFRLVDPLRAEVESAERELVRLTEEQVGALDMLVNQPRALVSGCAGSGKTVLAVEQARRIAAEGKRALLVCFNERLGRHLQRQLADDADITCHFFHGLCEEWCRRAGVPFDKPNRKDQSKKARRFWREDAPDLLLSAAAELGETFHAVIVDEGQDFQDLWFDALEELLEDAHEDRFIVFFDPCQNLFGEELPSRLSECHPFPLSYNCRCTQEVHSVAFALGGVDHGTSVREARGPKPRLVHCADNKEMVQKVEATLAHLLRQEEMAPGDIVILSPFRQGLSCLQNVRKLAGLDLCADAEIVDAGQLRFVTIRGFKGLESKVVLLINADLDDKVRTPADLYVATRRARSLLYIFTRTEALDERLGGRCVRE